MLTGLVASEVIWGRQGAMGYRLWGRVWEMPVHSQGTGDQ